MGVQVDHAEIKTGQLLTMATAAAAFFLREPLLLTALGLVFLVTFLVRPASPFVLFYRWVVRPLKIMRSDYRLDNIQAHAFGQLIGALTAAVAVGLLYLGYPLAAWTVVWILIGLTLISYLGWCIGCFLYYQLSRLGLGGFFRHKPTDSRVVPGARPRKELGEEQ